MFAFLGELLSKISLLFILHVTGGGAFPRPLSEREEEKYLSPDPSPQERGGSAKQREEDGCRGHNNGGNDDGS